MKKYFRLLASTWSMYLEYRTSFFMWRLRSVTQLLVIYFLWSAILQNNTHPFGYTGRAMMTYIMLTALIRPVVMGTRTQELGAIIQNGTLSNLLIRPVGIFQYFFTKDIADKVINLGFAFFEVVFLRILLKPELVIHADVAVLLLTAVSVGLGAAIFFYFSMILSMFGFWTMEVWGPRFLSLVLVEFFGGQFFPLDILPKWLYVVASALPFSYFVFFPAKVYLGGLTGTELARGFAVGVCWLWLLKISADLLWTRGLRVYGAEGK